MKKENTADAQPGAVEQNLNYKDAVNAGVALTLNGLVALARRIEICPFSKKAPPFAGYWSVFCGAIEKGEDAPSAAIREVKEETQLDLEKSKLMFIANIKNLALFRYELDEYKTIELDYEHTEYGYFKISQIHASPNPVDEEISRVLQYNNFINS